jgi:hypothetical protein
VEGQGRAPAGVKEPLTWGKWLSNGKVGDEWNPAWQQLWQHSADDAAAWPAKSANCLPAMLERC